MLFRSFALMSVLGLSSLYACACSVVIENTLDDVLVSPVEKMADSAVDSIKALTDAIDDQTEWFKPAYVGVGASSEGSAYTSAMTKAMQGTGCPSCSFNDDESLSSFYYKAQSEMLPNGGGRLYNLALYGQLLEKVNAQASVEADAILLSNETIDADIPTKEGVR